MAVGGRRLTTVTSERRLSTFEPMYFGDGRNGENRAKFKFRFKNRLMLPDDPHDGKDILDYNQRTHWIARIGYSIAR